MGGLVLVYLSNSEYFDVNTFWKSYKRADAFGRRKKLKIIAKAIRDEVNRLESIKILTEKEKDVYVVILLQGYFDDLANA